jgi:hypothetical protein
MGDNDERTSEEPLMLKGKIEEEDSQWLLTPEIRRSTLQRNSISWLIRFLPWFLLALLTSWNLIQYQRNIASTNFNPSQLIYSSFLLPPQKFIYI